MRRHALGTARAARMLGAYVLLIVLSSACSRSSSQPERHADEPAAAATHRSSAPDHVRLKNGSAVDGMVLGRDGHSLVLQLRRSDVASINGKPIPPPVVEGSVAPAFEAVDVLGATQRLRDPQAPSRATLLQFWATWCPHCRSDQAMMKDLFARYHDKGLHLLAISIDRDPSVLPAFIQEHGITYPVIAAADPRVSRHPSLPDLYEMQGVPAYYLIDDRGIILKTWSGSVTELGEDLEGAVTRALARN